jgi:CRP-like cAMP-binding protein
MEDSWTHLKDLESTKLAEQYDLSVEEVEIFKPYMRLYPMDGKMYSALDEDPNLYLLRCGEAEIVDEFDQAVLARVSAGQYFGRVTVGDRVDRALSIRACSSETLVYALSEDALQKLLLNSRWTKLLFEYMQSHLVQINSQLLQLKIAIQSDEPGSKIKVDIDAIESDEQQIIQSAKIFSTLLAIIKRIKDSVTVTSRAWYYVDTLEKQVMRLVKTFAPEIAEKMGEPDPVMLNMSLRRNTGFLNLMDEPEKPDR